jgi:hypothetical protein
MKKVIFVVEYEAKQPLLLRTEGIYDVATRLVDGETVPSIISRKMIRPLRDTLRTHARQTGDPWINTICNFPTERMCCYCIDCLIFGGTNADADTEHLVNIEGNAKKVRFNVRTLQLRSLVHPSDALAVTSSEKAIESETHTGVKEGRWADIGQAFYSPFQIAQGTRFIGTFMLDVGASRVNNPQGLINLFATIFMHTRRYGARTAQEGLVAPKILSVVKLPYEAITSYDLYGVVKDEKGVWDNAIKDFLERLKMEGKIPELEFCDWKVLTETELLEVISEDRLLGELRKALEAEGVSITTS